MYKKNKYVSNEFKLVPSPFFRTGAGIIPL